MRRPSALAPRTLADLAARLRRPAVSNEWPLVDVAYVGGTHRDQSATYVLECGHSVRRTVAGPETYRKQRCRCGECAA